jgi:hypothetical protein
MPSRTSRRYRYRRRQVWSFGYLAGEASVPSGAHSLVLGREWRANRVTTAALSGEEPFKSGTKRPPCWKQTRLYLTNAARGHTISARASGAGYPRFECVRGVTPLLILYGKDRHRRPFDLRAPRDRDNPRVSRLCRLLRIQSGLPVHRRWGIRATRGRTDSRVHRA